MVPLLTIKILDNRKPADASPTENGEIKDPPSGIESQTSCDKKDSVQVPYLSPLVLRKELESILEREGDACLSDPECVNEHPIIYWNLIWFFERIGVRSHLPGMCLKASSINCQQGMYTGKFFYLRGSIRLVEGKSFENLTFLECFLNRENVCILKIPWLRKNDFSTNNSRQF